MAPVAWDEVVFTHDKKAKEKVRKCGTSAKRKALQLGKSARVFSAVIHFNPTYGELDGAVFVPEDQEIPDVNQFLAELANGTHQIGGQRRVTRRRQKKTEAEPSQITEETSRIKVVEVASSVKEEPETVAAEDAAANEITSEDTDAPHEIEADNHGVGTFGGATPGAQQDEASSDEDPISSADQGLLTGTAKFDQNVSGVGDSVMGGNDTASAINASEEDSFVGLLEIGLHDLLEMEADGACAPAAGPVDASKLSILEEWSSNIIPDRERSDMEKTGGDGLMEDRAETNKAAPMQGEKTQKTPPTAARACHAKKSTQRIHRFLYLVSKQIRLAREQGDLEIGQVHQARLGVKALRKVQATAQHQGNRNVGLT